MARRSGDLLFVSGHVARDADGGVVRGVVGADIEPATAQQLARAVALDLLASAAAALGSIDSSPAWCASPGTCAVRPGSTANPLW